MLRTLVMGVTAGLALCVAPGPSEAAGVTRTQPFDYGTQCLTQDAQGYLVQTGVPGYPPTCHVVPDPDALRGELRTGQVRAAGAASVVQGSLQLAEARLGTTVGRARSTAGINVFSDTATRLQASATLTGITPGARVCLVILQETAFQPNASICGLGPTLAVGATVFPRSTYSIEVVLHDPTVSPAVAPNPCPPGMAVTCTFFAGRSMSGAEARLESITYSLG